MTVRPLTAWTNRRQIDVTCPPKFHLSTTWRHEDNNFREQPAYRCASRVSQRTMWGSNTQEWGAAILANLCTDCLDVTACEDVLKASYQLRLERLREASDFTGYLSELNLATKSAKTLRKLGIDVDAPADTDEDITRRAKDRIRSLQAQVGQPDGPLFPYSTVLNIVRGFNETATVVTAPPPVRDRTEFYGSSQLTGQLSLMRWADESNQHERGTVAYLTPGIIAAAHGITPNRRKATVPLDVAMMMSLMQGRMWNPRGWSKLTITPHGPFGHALSALGVLQVREFGSVKAILEPSSKDLQAALAIVS